MFGNQRESLVDLEKDPGEMTDLASDPASHGILLQMRDRLRQFGIERHDPLVARLLADDIQARPFTADGVQVPARRQKEEGVKGESVIPGSSKESVAGLGVPLVRQPKQGHENHLAAFCPRDFSIALGRLTRADRRRKDLQRDGRSSPHRRISMARWSV